MTLKEAIEELKDRYLGMSAYANREQCEKANKALDIAITALEKQIPKAAEHEDGAWSICPNCGGSICNDTEYATNKEVSYCEHCGQAIDWLNSEME